MDESEELIQEFLIESGENLSRLDQEFVELEKSPSDRELLSSIFRTIHTIKGTCGFLGFSTLEAITHRAENILSELREGRRLLTPALTTLLLETVDVVKGILAHIEANGAEGSEEYEPLRARLQVAADETQAAAAPAAPEAASPPAPEPAKPAAPPAAPPAAAKAPRAAHEKPPKLAVGADVPMILPPPPAIPERAAEGAAAAQPPAAAETKPPEAKPAAAAETKPAAAAPAAPPQPPAAPPAPAQQAAAAPAPPQQAPAPAQQAPAPREPEPATAVARATLAESTIRVDISVLDSLMNLVGELVLARNQIIQFTTTQRDVAFTATSQRLNLITTELQAHIMKTRMQPIGVVWNKLPRVVRDLGQSFGKQIELQMEGAHTELDKTIIEAIKDPLTHIVRNSCDHGIGTPEERAAAGKPPKGTLALHAYHEGGQVIIEITDDGRGIDAQRLKEKAIQNGVLTPERADRLSEHELVNLIFLPGLSTAKKITKVSGRGVGMDVVRTNIEKIGGSIDLQSRLGRGTTIKIKIPLTLAIIPALVVVCRGQRFAIPQVNLVELVRLEEAAAEQKIESIQGAPVYRLRGKLLPLVYLDQILGLDRADHERRSVSNIIVLQADERTFGLVVDGVNDTAEIVVKPLSKLLKAVNCYAGATIMGDGAVALILDVMGLAQIGGVVGETKEQGISMHEHSGESAAERQALLVFRSGEADRLAVPLSAVNRLEEFPRNSIEQSGGSLVVQYRDRILPLVALANYGGGSGEESDRVQVIVFEHEGKQIGALVEEILDIVEEQITVRSPANRPGVLGSAVLGNRVTDLVDLRYLIESTDPDWFSATKKGALAGVRVMVAESSPFSRGVLRSYLETGGFEVVEASDADEVLQRLTRHKVDVLLTGFDLEGGRSFELLRRIREAPELRALPVVCLSDDPGGVESRLPGGYAFDECLSKFDQQAMLDSVGRLAGALRSGRGEPAVVSA
jgi:two-component system, chemotaxis family, sensor kinase CheA